MRKRIQKLGRLKLVCLITLLASILAIIGNLVISSLFDFHTSLFEDVFRASVIPVFVVPFVSWYLVGLLYQLDRLEQDMSILARVDGLTLLSNRRFFYQQIDDWHKAASNNGIGYAFFVLDMDFFKRINDEYGHMWGDKVLEKVADILRQHAPSPNITGRLGGEEFAVFLPNIPQSEAEEIAQNICQSAGEIVIEQDGRQLTCSISIGISININRHQESIEDAFKYADLAMYHAKKSGRSCYRVYLADEKRLANELGQ